MVSLSLSGNRRRRRLLVSNWRVTLVVAMATFYEEFKIKSQDLVDKVKGILHEGNVRRIL
jgi:hypothetical protein